MIAKNEQNYEKQNQLKHQRCNLLRNLIIQQQHKIWTSALQTVLVQSHILIFFTQYMLINTNDDFPPYRLFFISHASLKIFSFIFQAHPKAKSDSQFSHLTPITHF
ncbi:hypothetical protein ACOSQ4_009699 [Xanthoceras sorbifolium]